MPTDPAIRELIITRIRTGALPRTGRYQIFAGKGNGVLCACCERAIRSDHVQYDVEIDDENYGEVISLPMHLACFNVWSAEPASPRDLVSHGQRSTDEAVTG